jgi:thiamine pyrophosphate-dependent acetolactate synthase large subunit-like protein
VHVDVPPDVTGVAVTDSSVADASRDPAALRGLSAATEELVRRTRRPVFLVGLGARTSPRPDRRAR